jgi:prepilin-type N-terminal cleavage/methylation domain-containing protein
LERFFKKSGYSIIELLVVIIIISIITAVALKSLRTVSDTSRVEKTKKELEQLACGISGDPNVTSGGARTSFGYVGDVGGMPPNLDALVSNPGSFATWKGPYLRDDYLPSSGSSNTEFKIDEWGTAYNFSGNTISSTGGSSTITRKVANSVSDLIYNTVAVTVTDQALVPPGNTGKDSVRIVLTHPNGSGGMNTKTRYPAKDGFVAIDSVPIGQHTLKVIYTPLNDTLTRKVTVNPGELTSVNVSLFRPVWASTSGGGTGGTPQSVIIRPSGNGSWTQNDDLGCSSNWQCVDESTSDNDATYIGDNDENWETDTYQAINPSVTGTIDSVVIRINVRMTSGTNDNARTVIVVGGTRYYGSTIDLDAVTSYSVYSTKYATNPGTSSAWIWTDINNLEIGIDLDDDARCTQVWAEVFYR